MFHERRLLTVFLAITIISQAKAALAFEFENKKDEGNVLQNHVQVNGPAQDFYQQIDAEGNFTEVEDLLNELDEEIINVTSTEEPPSLGKELRLRLREVFVNHHRRMEEIRLERRLFMEGKKQEMKELISEFKVIKNALCARVRQSLENIRQLRQEFMNGTITKEEFKAELERMRLEFRSQVQLMINLGNRIWNSMQEVTVKNQELALEILSANLEFRQELQQIMNQAREQWRKRGH
ncbi:MAG: hypothetical protein QW201_01455 [Thermoproteota archaeon]